MMTDRQGDILVGLVPQGLWNENLTRQTLHGTHDILIIDTATAEFKDQLCFPVFKTHPNIPFRDLSVGLCVMSTLSGVTATAPRLMASRSVPLRNRSSVRCGPTQK